MAYRSEAGLVSALAQGPVALSIQTAGSQLRVYIGGIYYFSTCPGTRPDHAVTAVGYTEDAIVMKNSWGTNCGGMRGTSPGLEECRDTIVYFINMELFLN